MKKYFYILFFLLIILACSDFEEINKNPYTLSEDLIQVEFFLNNSITSAQMDPHIAERIFVLHWHAAARYSTAAFSTAAINDGWSSDYYGGNYLGKWINTCNDGIQQGMIQIEKQVAQPYVNNAVQMMRIWRAYLISEGADMFGPYPIANNEGKPEFKSVEDVYKYILTELSDAVSKISGNDKPTSTTTDKFYAFESQKWKKFGNSLRLRYAMRLSKVAPDYAKIEFEKAITDATVSGSLENLILNSEDIAQVQEQPGWDVLTGVMSREWNSFLLSSTVNNLFIGLGGIKSENLLPPTLKITRQNIVNEKNEWIEIDTTIANAIKPANYLGIEFPDQLTKKTNSPGAGYYLDGLPHAIDPRAYKLYIIPGWLTNNDYCLYPSGGDDAKIFRQKLFGATENSENKPIDTLTLQGQLTWNTYVTGSWGKVGARNEFIGKVGTTPRLALKFRNSTIKRIFFAHWETYFLLAEASVRGWNIGTMSGQESYEKGINASFEYLDVEQHAEDYISSPDYNRCGTSVNWNHTAEPPTTTTMNYQKITTFKPLTTTNETTEMAYAKNDLYENGTVKNDRLTKIITQKYLAQLPWLPLEVWNDHRRLGLPFFDNPAREEAISTLPALTEDNVTNSVSIKYFPQRVRYPNNLSTNSPDLYNSAKNLLGGEDDQLTPLWWAQKTP